MADCICKSNMHPACLERVRAEARREALKEARNAQCNWCNTGHEFRPYSYAPREGEHLHPVGGRWFPCEANAIRALRGEEEGR